jgi:hypothetical protein
MNFSIVNFNSGTARLLLIELKYGKAIKCPLLRKVV